VSRSSWIARSGLRHARCVRFAFLALGLAACTYPAWELDTDTQLKCDPENPCPADYFCTGGATTSGTCYREGLVGCANQPLSRYWGFDTDDEGWSFDYDRASGAIGEMAWTDTVGTPRAGALDIQFTGTVMSERLAWIRPPAPIGDVAAKTISARIWTDRAGLLAKAFINNGNGGAGWTDGGAVQLDPQRWTCVTLDVGNPSYTDPDRPLDAGNVYELGLQIDGVLGGATTIAIDDVGY
jgi:hypothetical protein